MGIPCLMCVAFMYSCYYSTMEIGTVPGPSQNWARSKFSKPLALPPITLSPFASLLRLNPKCCCPAMLLSERRSIRTCDTLPVRLTQVLS